MTTPSRMTDLSGRQAAAVFPWIKDDQRPGVMPNAFLNCLLKWLWSLKPASIAICAKGTPAAIILRALKPAHYQETMRAGREGRAEMSRQGIAVETRDGFQLTRMHGPVEVFREILTRQCRRPPRRPGYWLCRLAGMPVQTLHQSRQEVVDEQLVEFLLQRPERRQQGRAEGLVRHHAVPDEGQRRAAETVEHQ